MHLVESTARSLVERGHRAFRPTVTFRQQRHRQEDRGGRGGKAHANVGVSACAKAPFQRRSHIVDGGEVRDPFLAGRQGQPFDAAPLQPAPIVCGVENGQIGSFGFANFYLENVGAGGVEKTVAHHGADRPRRHNRLRDKTVHRAKDS